MCCVVVSCLALLFFYISFLSVVIPLSFASYLAVREKCTTVLSEEQDMFVINILYYTRTCVFPVFPPRYGSCTHHDFHAAAGPDERKSRCTAKHAGSCRDVVSNQIIMCFFFVNRYVPTDPTAIIGHVCTADPYKNAYE